MNFITNSHPDRVKMRLNLGGITNKPIGYVDLTAKKQTAFTMQAINSGGASARPPS